jgi:hypothetical protein
MNFLLRKKLIFIVLGLLIIVVVSFFVFKPNTASYKGGEVLPGGINSIINAVAGGDTDKKDSDSDGLKDWEENLWGTNINNVDTDGDGTNDGDEVDNNRNPLIAGPDDVFQENAFTKQELSDSSDGLTETEKFSQEFFREYLSLKNSGISFDDEGVQDFFLSSTLEKAQIAGSSNVYTSDDINIIYDNSREAVRAYGNAMGNIISKYSVEKENEAVILKNAVETNSKKELEKLDPIIVAYKDHIRDFLTVSVPQNAVGVHLRLINSFSSLAYTIEGMRVVFEDPLTTLNSIAVYQSDVQELADSFIDSNEYFNIENVSFDENESGYLFTHII